MATGRRTRCWPVLVTRSFASGIKESGGPEVTRSMRAGIWKGSKNIRRFGSEDPREAAAVISHDMIKLKKFMITGVICRMQIRVGLIHVRQATKIKNECENE